MAGGSGSRLRPLTCDLPKPMVPMVNRPVMSYAINILRDLGVEDVGVTLQYLPEKIQRYYEDGKDYGLNLSYYIEDSPLGTAGSVKNTNNFLQDTFIVISGDALTDFDLQPAIDFHREQGALATLVLTKVPVPLEYGVVITDSEKRITKFLEKPGWGEVFSDTVNTGIYILEPEILQYIPENSFFDFSKDLFPLLLEKGLGLYGYNLNGFWCDIGDLDQYRHAQYRLLSGETRWDIKPGREIKPGIWVGDECVVEAGSTLIPPVVIGSNSYISREAEIGPYSVIGEGVHIGPESSIRHTIVWPEAKINKGATIRGAVIGRGVDAGPRVRVFEGAAIGNKVRLHAKAAVHSNVLVWPDKEIIESQVLTDNLVWGNLVRERNLLTPEQGIALGRAYANLWKKTASSMVLSCGFGHLAYQMLQNAVSLGIQASGVVVNNIFNVPLPVARYYSRRMKLPAIHLGIGEDGEVEPQFLDEKGVTIGNAHRRKLSQLQRSQEFAEVPFRNWSNSRQTEVDYNQYILDISSNCQKAAVSRTIALSGPQFSFWNKRFGDLGHRLIYRENRQGVITAIQNGEADLGAEIGLNGERLIMLNEQGMGIKHETVLTLLLEIVLFHNKGGAVVAPITIVEAAERLGQRWHAEVLKSKMDPAANWAAITSDFVNKSQPWLKQRDVWGDAYAQLLYICDYLAIQGSGLAGLIEQLPLGHRLEKNISCPWEVKGQVVRKLLEAYPSNLVDTTDGVKVLHPDGWALAIPNLTHPEYRILAEGANQEIARSLTGELEEKITEILRQ